MKSEFSYSSTDWHIKDKEFNLYNYVSIAWRTIVEFLSFPKAFALCEMQTVLFRFTIECIIACKTSPIMFFFFLNRSTFLHFFLFYVSPGFISVVTFIGPEQKNISWFCLFCWLPSTDKDCRHLVFCCKTTRKTSFDYFDRQIDNCNETKTFFWGGGFRVLEIIAGK